MADLRVPDLNRVVIAGRLTSDPDLRYISSGTAVCRLRIANTRYFKRRDGERGEENVFVDVTCWDRQAEYVGDRFRKGRPVLVEGRLKTDTWEDKETGQKRSKVEILAQRVTPLDWDDNAGPGGGQGGGGSRASSGGGGSSSYGGGSSYDGDRPPRREGGRQEPREIEEPIPDDDIPF